MTVTSNFVTSGLNKLIVVAEKRYLGPQVGSIKTKNCLILLDLDPGNTLSNPVQDDLRVFGSFVR